MSCLAGVDGWLTQAAAARYQSRRLAALCGVSDRHLRRFFIETTDLSTQHWLDEVRLWESLDRLLHEPLRRIKEISFDLGYSSQNRFCLRFTRRFGVCPSRLPGNEQLVLKAITAAPVHPYWVGSSTCQELKRLQARVLAVLRARDATVLPTQREVNRKEKSKKGQRKLFKSPRGVNYVREA